MFSKKEKNLSTTEHKLGLSHQMPPVVTIWRCALSCGTPVCVEVLESTAGLLPRCTSATPPAPYPAAAASSSRHLLLLFPGNPGIVHYYKEFVSCLDVKNVDVLVMGFAGHSLHELNNGKFFELQHQIELADRFCRTVLTAHVKRTYRSCNVGGHSIGGYVALHMLNRFPKLIDRGFLLTPTICNMRQSPNGSSKDALLKAPLIRAVCATAVPLMHMLPTCVKRYVINHTQKNMNDHGRWVSEQLTRPNVTRNILMLARSEFEEVATLDVSMVQSVQDRLVMYFVKQDGWVPMSDVDAIRVAAPLTAGFVIEDDENVAHAWCLQHSEAVVRNGIVPFLNCHDK